MECTIERVTRFTQEFEDREEKSAKAVASVTLGMGPVHVRAHLFQRESDEKMWLSMPGRKTKDDKWFDYVKFVDYSVFKQLEQQAVLAYKTQNN